MRIVNKSNIPAEIFDFLSQNMYDRKSKENSISATGLLKPIQEIILIEKYDDKIEVDAADRLWALIGNGVHAVLEFKKDNDNVQKEERLYADYSGYEVSGKFDLIVNNRLKDYKTTSAWTSVFGGRQEEWKKQLSIYRSLYYKVHNVVLDETADIIIIYRDWNKSQSERVKNYPAKPIDIIHIKCFTICETDFFIKEKINRLKFLKIMPDKNLPECTQEERWYSAKTKKYNKCEKYCPAYKFCQQIKREVQNENEF